MNSIMIPFFFFFSLSFWSILFQGSRALISHGSSEWSLLNSIITCLSNLVLQHVFLAVYSLLMRNKKYLQILSLIFWQLMGLLFLRHALALPDSDDEDDASAFFSVS